MTRIETKAGDGKGTAPILTKTFGWRARGTKAEEATKDHVQPQNGDSQQPHGHSSAGIEQTQAGVSPLPGHRGKGKVGMGNSPAQTCPRRVPSYP